MADLEAKIPEKIKRRLDHLLAPGGLLDGSKEGNVDVGMRRHLAPPVAADGHDRQAFALRAVTGRIDVIDDMIVNHAKELIHKECLRLGDIVPGGGALDQSPCDFRPPIVERPAQHLHDRLAALGMAMLLDNPADGVDQRAPVYHGAG